MMRIGVDAMGGDFAPLNVIYGAVKALEVLPENVQLFLLGDKIKIAEICRQQGIDSGLFVVVHCPQTILMGDHPVKAYIKKNESSIVRGFSMLEKGELDAFASAGNTGAMLVGSMQTLKPISRLLRPCISAEFPLLSGGNMLILDVGFNSDCRSEMLCQFARLGAIYAKTMMGIKEPKVALLNMGEEAEKGNLVNRETFEVLSDSNDLNFVGNMEANNMFEGGIADVLVTDGFTGNICLKQAEAMYNIIDKLKIKDDFLERFNYEIYGGTPVLGVAAPVVIGHGASSAKAICNMILTAERYLSNKLIEKFENAMLS